MYKTQEEKTVIEDEEVIVYGVSDENRFYCGFTLCRETADEVAALLNENDVATCHVIDVIEDMFYSGQNCETTAD